MLNCNCDGSGRTTVVVRDGPLPKTKILFCDLHGWLPLVKGECHYLNNADAKGLPDPTRSGRKAWHGDRQAWLNAAAAEAVACRRSGQAYFVGTSRTFFEKYMLESSTAVLDVDMTSFGFVAIEFGGSTLNKAIPGLMVDMLRLRGDLHTWVYWPRTLPECRTEYSADTAKDLESYLESFVHITSKAASQVSAGRSESQKKATNWHPGMPTTTAEPESEN